MSAISWICRARVAATSMRDGKSLDGEAALLKDFVALQKNLGLGLSTQT